MKKTIYLLDINDYEPEIKAITLPFIETWAQRIGAEIVRITERKWPEYPVVYEKLQIFELAKANKSDWHIYIDLDCLIHPEFYDITELLEKDTVFQHGRDFSPNRADVDEYMRRDGRFIGTANWFTVFSDWCLDLYRPLDDMTLEEAMARMHPTVQEMRRGMVGGHLIDDFVLTRNVARFGLKHMTMEELFKKYPKAEGWYLAHVYLEDGAGKVKYLKETLEKWGLSLPK